MKKSKKLNSEKLAELLKKWPDLTNYCQEVKRCDILARMELEGLIEAVKKDELIAKELEEVNQFKLKL